MKPKVLTPHDIFFQKSLQRLAVAKDFFMQTLPAEIQQVIDWGTLSLSSEMLYDDDFGKRIPDSIFTAKMGDHIGYLYNMTEHLSGNKKICVEAFQKKNRLIERHCAIYDTDKLPLVHTTVLYHGGGEYTHSTKISDYIEAPPELRQDNLHSQLQLIDLNTIPDEQLRQHFLAGALQYALKHIRANDIVEVLKQGFSSWLADLEAENSDFVQDLVQYFVEAGRFNDPEELKQVIYQKLPQTGEKMNNLFEHERQQGVQQGMQQGKTIGFEEASLKIAKRLLAQNFPIDKIADLTNLDPQTIRTLNVNKDGEEE